MNKSLRKHQKNIKKNIKLRYKEKVKEYRKKYFEVISIKRLKSYFKSAHFPAYAICVLLSMFVTPIVAFGLGYPTLYKLIIDKKIKEIDLLELT